MDFLKYGLYFIIMDLNLGDWMHLPFFATQQYQKPMTFIETERHKGKIILPRSALIFTAFQLTPFSATKVVILGQDPYPNTRHAMGLAFSIPAATLPYPPTLTNILKELQTDTGIYHNSDLRGWARQGVLLLNTVLSIEIPSPLHTKPTSHTKIGWEQLITEVLTTLSQTKDHIVFVLWGRPAQRYAPLIDTTKHSMILTPHPSPLSAYRGFFGSRPFSTINNHLCTHHQQPIDWRQ